MTDIEKYIEERAKMSINGDEIHSLHVGTDREVHLRVSDIQALAARIEELEAAVIRQAKIITEFPTLFDDPADVLRVNIATITTALSDRDTRIAELEAWLDIAINTAADKLITKDKHIAELEADLQKAADIAQEVNEWCKPIGQYKHMVWYQDCGAEIAEAIRTNLKETHKLALAANGGSIPPKETDQ